ncbi:MAG TPA: pantetheine-phosphate adenylyltransferase [Gemmataceae bacterium]|nr:pantetheine-phosphate adenylyltransferase [Gemmataceae bacterium]
MAKSLTSRVAVYTGMFDPVHLGHLDIIRRGSRLFDRLVVGVGINPEKAPLFTAEERVDLLRQVVKRFDNVEVEAFDGLAVRFVRDVGANVMLRGLRTLTDMEYEFTMTLTNLSLDNELETIFLMAKEEYSHVSSTLLRQIASFKGDLSKFVTSEVKDALERKFQE